MLIKVTIKEHDERGILDRGKTFAKVCDVCFASNNLNLRRILCLIY